MFPLFSGGLTTQQNSTVMWSIDAPHMIFFQCISYFSTVKDLVTRSNFSVTISTWLYAKYAKTDDLSDSVLKSLKVAAIVTVFTMGHALGYHSSCTLISQAFFACGQLLQNKQRKYFIALCVFLSTFVVRNLIANRTTELKRAPRRVTFEPTNLHQILKSQSGERSYMRSSKDDDLSASHQPDNTKTEDLLSVVVHAGAHHSVRMRASKPSNDPWSMNKIFLDSNTIKSDLKLIKTKFADEQRDHFASQGAASCNSTQVTPIQNLMMEMKISIPSSDGMSSQEVTQNTSSETFDDAMV